jgi:uncharacterized protein YybS (DUF2232 family)
MFTRDNTVQPSHILPTREVAVGIAATLIFFFSVLLIPMVGIFIGVFTPLPTLLSYYRWGYPVGLWIPGGAILSSLLLFASLSMAQSLPYLIELLLLGLILGMGMRRDWSLEKTIGGASLLVFIVGAVLFLLNQDSHPGGVFQGLEEGLREAVRITLQQYAGTTPEARLLEETLAAMIPIVVRVLPGACLASALVISWMNLLVTKRYCTVRQLPLPSWDNWLHWRAFEQLVWIVILSGFALLIPIQPVKIIALNLLIVLGTVYFFQGLAIVTFYFERWNLPKILRAILYSLLLLQQFASLGAVLLGFFDVWLDFRRLSKNSASPSANNEQGR